MRTLLAAVTAAMLLTSGAVASTGTREYTGGCRWVPDNETGTGTAEGVWGRLYTATAVYSDAGPVSATVTCEVAVDGYVAADATYSFSGTGVVAGVSPRFRFVGPDSARVDVCTRVTYDNGEVDESCAELSSWQIPPQPVIDVLDDIVGVLNGVLAVGDAVLCPLIGGLAPGVPGVVDIEAGGDVSLAGELLWDCLPYRA